MTRKPALVAVALLLGGTHAVHATRPAGPLDAVVRSWSETVASDRSTDEFGKQVKEGAAAGLARVEQAMKEDRRLLALLRMSTVTNDVTALDYIRQRSPEQRKDAAAFEAEWKRVGEVLAADLKPASGALESVRPAAVRAIGEASLPQIGVFYHASLDYGRSTEPDSGLYYLGAALGQRDFETLLKNLAMEPGREAPSVRSVAGELEDLQNDLLAAYRPPASVDRHREFIVANSALKEARELHAAGLRHGALLRYLQAAVRASPLRPDAPAIDATIAPRLDALSKRLDTGSVDHSLGRLLLEWAQADLAEHATDGQAAIAAAIANDALPRYFAALEPERARPAAPAAAVTVTLVRWPYT